MADVVASAAGTALESWTRTEYDDVNRRVVVRSDIEQMGDGRKVAIQHFDQLGRVRLARTLEDPLTEDPYNETHGIKVETRYRAAGPCTFESMKTCSFQLTSNPFRAATSAQAGGEETMGWTLSETRNDGRYSRVQTFSGAALPAPWGSNSASSGKVVTEIDANTTTVTDQAGKKRRSVTNALGQLVRVDEPDAAGNLGTVSNPVQPTYYAYDALNNLTTVSQGVQTRTFAYNSLSRLISATNPESGTINYSYDANGNLTSKTDARGVVTSYVYDALNRVTQRSYSTPNGTPGVGVLANYQATPNVEYFYDGANVAGGIANSKGKLTKVSSAISTTEYTAFDILGRVTAHKQTTDGTAYTTGYIYNLSGALVEQTYPSGRVVRNTLDPDGSLSQVQSRKANDTFRNYANAFTYNTAGAVTSMRLGNGLWETTAFNSRLQPIQIGLGSGSATQNKLKLDYSFGTAANNGNVLSQTITVKRTGQSDLVFVQTYAYDSLNRISSAEEKTGTTMNWRQTYTFDRYGNRRFNQTDTTFPTFEGPNISNPQIDTASNRFADGQGYAFDFSGNLITDPEGNSFIYDAQNRQSEVKNTGDQTIGKYYFDGDGRRVKKFVPSTGETTIFVHDAAGKLIAEYSTLVTSSANAKTQYLTHDNLGTPRINSDALGSVVSRSDFMPYGEEIVAFGGRSSSDKYVPDDVRQGFTGYEDDLETSLHYSWARMYSQTHGRFQVPDPYWGSALSVNPQSWNRYSYAVNNAPNFIDKFGLVWLRKGNDYFWVDDKDFEKHGEIWKKNGHYDEVIQNGTIIELGDRQDNDRARSFAGKRVMLGNGNRVEEVDESGAMIVRGSDAPGDPIEMEVTNDIRIQEPVLKCSILVQNPYLRFFGANHEWLKTNQKEVGAEKAPGDPRNEELSLFNLPYMTLMDCAGSSSSPGASCQIVRGIDVDILNSELEIGKPLPGRWGLGNNCQTVVDNLLNNSRKGPRPQPAPTP